MENNETKQVNTPSHILFKKYINLNTKSLMQKGNTYETRTSTNTSKLTEDISRLHYKDKTVVYGGIIVIAVKFVGDLGTCSVEQIFYSIL
jgi:hypothetical protein